MPTDPTAPVVRELLVRQLETWLPAALHRSRRATVALAYAGGDAESSADALRVVAEYADRLRGRRLTVLVLATAADLPARLGPVEAALPPEVAVHVVPGDPSRLPVAAKASGAAGAPTFSFVDAAGAPTGNDADSPPGADAGPPVAGRPAGVDAAVLAATAIGRPAEVLLRLPGGSARAALGGAGFPLTTEVELVPADGLPVTLAFGTGSDRSLEAVKEALWAVDEFAGVRYRDPADPAGRLLDIALDPEPGPLRRELLAELARSGPRTVTELRRYTLTSTVYRSTDAVRALTGLLNAGAVTRDPAHGRLGGDVVVSPATPT
ncbi:hypothetical protein ACFOOK_30875 [Micromonospora krabiensis]|uniref:Uncharacterized protein n=1 Tax=Micromonospora krabiensis TaxID=307121 RepID=A0A1C3N384_9ACTN|nr:hypothetical protein [Micromonospora krabiensis]SBV27031.1 hypothetical protein GA0070620_2532 [Micromonospora krabiensis]